MRAPPRSPLLNLSIPSSPVRSPRRIMNAPRQLDEGEDEELPDLAPPDDREHQFDQLFDDEAALEAQIDEELLGDLDEDLGSGADSDLEDDYYSENFGLPDANEEPLGDVPLERQFQLPLDDNPEPPGDDPDDEVDLGERCAAFRGPRLIRNAYADALIQKIRFGATHPALKHQLKSARRQISTHPDLHAHDLFKMAVTIGTAERGLGVSTEDLITTFTLCPTCKRRYSPTYISNATDNVCLNNDCSGILFIERTLATRSRRRISNLTYPFASPIIWLQDLLNLCGVAELMQNWQHDEDDHNWGTAPVPWESWIRHLDANKPLGDLSDGWRWRSTEAGLERIVDDRTHVVYDRSVVNPAIRFVGLPFGISLSMNTDWYVCASLHLFRTYCNTC
jgi:hypothetical protein